jgi:hypothetical protein
MAKNNLMSAISGLSEAKPDTEKVKEKSKAKKPKVVNLGKGGSFTIKHPGGLHKATGTPMGEKIPESKIEAASHSKNEHVRRMAASAKGFAAMKHGG